MIIDISKKVKDFYHANKQDIFIAAVIFLVGLASFGLGRLSILWPEKTPLVIEGPDHKAISRQEPAAESKNYASMATGQGKYVASKNGTAYHFPWCPGAQKIKEENKIWFQTKGEAESRGYKPAGNCEGL